MFTHLTDCYQLASLALKRDYNSRCFGRDLAPTCVCEPRRFVSVAFTQGNLRRFKIIKFLSRFAALGFELRGVKTSPDRFTIEASGSAQTRDRYYFAVRDLHAAHLLMKDQLFLWRYRGAGVARHPLPRTVLTQYLLIRAMRVRRSTLPRATSACAWRSAFRRLILWA